MVKCISLYLNNVDLYKGVENAMFVTTWCALQSYANVSRKIYYVCVPSLNGMNKKKKRIYIEWQPFETNSIQYTSKLYNTIPVYRQPDLYKSHISLKGAA